MSAALKLTVEFAAATVADMSAGLGADLMPCSNIETGDMASGAGVALMPCSN